MGWRVFLANFGALCEFVKTKLIDMINRNEYQSTNIARLN